MTRTILAFGTEGTIFDRAGAPRAARPADAPPPARPALVFEGVQRGRAPAWLDLTVMAGEVMTLLGPAGSGKTAALEMAAGLLPAARGRILLNGDEIGRRPAHRRNLGWVPRPLALFPGLTALENVALPLEARGLSRAEREDRAAAALRAAGMDAVAVRPAALDPEAALRVALARATAYAPPVLLLDDPLADLDPAARPGLIRVIRGLLRAGDCAALHVTRDAATAMALSDRIAVMADGRVRQVGTPRALYDTPADDGIAALLGEVNRLPGEVLSAEDDACRVALDGGPEAVGLPVAGHGRALSPGARCVLTIRPEHVAVAAMAAADLGEDALPATLIESAFAGDHLRLRLRLEGGAELLARRPAGLPLPTPGAPAAIAWNPGAARVYAAEGAAVAAP